MISRLVFRMTAVAGFVLILSGVVAASDEDLKKELMILKQKVAELEAKIEPGGKLEKEPGKGAALTRTEAAKEEKEGSEERRPHLLEIKEEIKEAAKDMWGLEFHGGVTAFVQGSPSVRIEQRDISSTSGAGIAADLQLTWKPGLPLFQNSRFFMRAHVGEGLGADKELGDRLFANVNTIADDSSDDAFRLLEAYYAQDFFDGKFTAIIGKTQTTVVIDTNNFANNPNSQFIGKPFVNNPVFNSENSYAPLVAASFSPNEMYSFAAVYSSSGRPNAPVADQKDVWDDIFDTPLVAGQFNFSPKFGDMKGNYRVYIWDAAYDHSVSTANNHEDGWGVGLSFDQEIVENIGLFARAGYNNKDAFDVDWFWAGGASLKGLIPSRGDDEIGIGVAGLKGHADFRHDGTEFHIESYYRIALTDNIAITPDIQYVANPLGNDNNDGVFVGAVRGEFSF